MFQHGSLPESFIEGIISLKPKNEKNLTDPANYKPTNLINVDCKILSKILALRLNKVLPQVIHKDQVGVIKDICAANNMRRRLHLIWMNRTNPHPILTISLDA